MVKKKAAKKRLSKKEIDKILNEESKKFWTYMIILWIFVVVSVFSIIRVGETGVIEEYPGQPVLERPSPFLNVPILGVSVGIALIVGLVATYFIYKKSIYGMPLAAVK